MSRHTFAPKTRQEDERPITRIQEDFSGGMVRDVTKIPDNAIANLIDMVSKGDYLETSVGSRKWGDWVNMISQATMPTTGNFNGCYFHKNKKQIVIQLGTALYLASDIYMSSWNLCYDVSVSVTLSDSISTFDEYQDYVFIFNSNGIFKLNLRDTKRYYYNINTEVPNIGSIINVNTDSNDPEKSSNATTYPYGRKYIYTFSRLNGTVNGNRQTAGVYIEAESGSSKRPFGSTTLDYVACWNANPIISTNGNLLNTLDNVVTGDTSIQYTYTHYSIYATKDIGVNGTDPVFGEGNNKELFIWLDDVPIVKSFKISISGSTVTATHAVFNSYDVGSVIYTEYAVGTSYTITAVTDSTHCTISGTATLSNVMAHIGGNVSFPVYSFNTTTKLLTVDFADYTPTVGTTLHFSDQSVAVITEVGAIVDGKNTVYIDTTSDKTGLGVTYLSTQRKYTDYITDAVLDSRINAAYTLNQRFYEPLPDCNVGVISNGFLVGAIRDANYVYYSQLPLGMEYLCGSYFSPFQYANITDNIQAITKHTDKVVIWCNNSRHAIKTTLYENKLTEKIGVSYSVLTNQQVINNTIGILDYGAWCYLPQNDAVLFISSEPGVRIFNGEVDTDNLATDRIMEDLKLFAKEYTISYDDVNGITIWGIV